MASEKPTLHHLNNSQSQQTLWLLEELGIEYNLVLHERQKDQRAPPALKETHPLGKAPQLVTPSGRVITERSAIALYLIDTYDVVGRFRIPSPTSAGAGGEVQASEPDVSATEANTKAASIDENDAIREEHLLSLGATTLNGPLMVRFILTALVRQTPFLARPLVTGIKYALDSAFLDAEIDAVMRYLDGQLEGREWFMGTPGPTRVDFCLHWYVDWAVQGGFFDLGRYARVGGWWERVCAREAWKRGLEKGNGYVLKL